jgi:hypothetical protein
MYMGTNADVYHDEKVGQRHTRPNTCHQMPTYVKVAFRPFLAHGVCRRHTPVCSLPFHIYKKKESRTIFQNRQVVVTSMFFHPR